MLHDRILACDLPAIALLLSSAKSEEMQCSGRCHRALEDERSRAIWDRDRFIESCTDPLPSKWNYKINLPLLNEGAS